MALAIQDILKGNWDFGLLLETAGGGVFTAGGVFMHFGVKPLVLDTRSGRYFRVGHLISRWRVDRNMQGSLAGVHAIQIVVESVSSDSGSYHSYEINLVFQDGFRLNVMDHGDARGIERSALLLGTVLNKPVWAQTRRL